MKNAFGKYIRKHRTINKVSLRQAEKSTGVSNPYISQLERGLRPPPSPYIIRQIANGYGISYEGLLRKAGYLD